MLILWRFKKGFEGKGSALSFEHPTRKGTIDWSLLKPPVSLLDLILEICSDIPAGAVISLRSNSPQRSPRSPRRVYFLLFLHLFPLPIIFHRIFSHVIHLCITAQINIIIRVTFIQKILPFFLKICNFAFKPFLLFWCIFIAPAF